MFAASLLAEHAIRAACASVDEPDLVSGTGAGTICPAAHTVVMQPSHAPAKQSTGISLPGARSMSRFSTEATSVTGAHKSASFHSQLRHATGQKP